MRCSSNLAFHILRQHAARMSPVQPGLQANALFCVLPHLKPDTLLSASVSFSRALPYSAQAEPQLKVKPYDQPAVSKMLNFREMTSFCPTCSEQIYSTRIQSRCSFTEILMSQGPKWQLAGFGRLCLLSLAFIAKKASS